MAARRANRKTKNDGKKEGQTERNRERPRKCLQGANQEEVPVAITTAVALVAMGTSRAETTESGRQGQKTLSFIFSGKGIRRKYVKQHSLFGTSLYFTRNHMIGFSTL